MIRPLQLFHIKLSKTPENSIQFNSNAYKISAEYPRKFLHDFMGEKFLKWSVNGNKMMKNIFRLQFFSICGTQLLKPSIFERRSFIEKRKMGKIFWRTFSWIEEYLWIIIFPQMVAGEIFEKKLFCRVLFVMRWQTIAGFSTRLLVGFFYWRFLDLSKIVCASKFSIKPCATTNHYLFNWHHPNRLNA